MLSCQIYFTHSLQLFDYKLDRYVIAQYCIEQVNALGAGETFGTLKQLSDTTLADNCHWTDYQHQDGLNTLKQVTKYL